MDGRWWELGFSLLEWEVRDKQGGKLGWNINYWIRDGDLSMNACLV